MGLSKVDRATLRKCFPWYYRLAVYIGLLSYSSAIVKSGEEVNCHATIDVNKLHPLYILFAIVLFPFQIFPIPILGTLIYFAMITGDHKHEYFVEMSHRHHRKRGGSSLKNVDERRKEKEKESLNSSKKRMVVDKSVDLPDVWDDESLEEYYARLEDMGMLDRLFDYGKEGSSSSTASKSTTTKVTTLSETEEAAPRKDVRIYQPSAADDLPDDYFVPEDEVRIDNLRNAITTGYVKSVERYLKKKYNIYPTDFGYALERISHDRFKIFLDLNIDYLKVWEVGDKTKTELLSDIVREIETGELQLSYRQTLTSFMEEYKIEESLIPENKKNCYSRYYRVVKTMEDLGITKATRNSKVTSLVV